MPIWEETLERLGGFLEGVGVSGWGKEILGCCPCSPDPDKQVKTSTKIKEFDLDLLYM